MVGYFVHKSPFVFTTILSLESLEEQGLIILSIERCSITPLFGKCVSIFPVCILEQLFAVHISSMGLANESGI